MQEILLKIKYFERGLSKSLKKVNFIFPFKPSQYKGYLSLLKRLRLFKRHCLKECVSIATFLCRKFELMG